MLWTLIHIADLLLWFFMAGSVGYVVVFSLLSLFPRHSKAASQQSTTSSDVPSTRFLVLFPAYQEDRVICNSVETFLQQDYPRHLFQVMVISDHMQAATNQRLSTLPITLLQPAFRKSSKAHALQYAIAGVEGGRSEGVEGGPTHVVVLDADNIVAPDFLARLDAVCRQGYVAIQCHRTAKNSDNDIAMLDGVSEEINNSLFRHAHNNIGLSSALIGSGMCFEYSWFKENVGRLDSVVEDRELEALLMRQDIFIRYEEQIFVMDEKVSSQDNFQRQRMRWMTGQVQALLQMLPYLPTAIRTCNINYIDKTIQQMLIPRSILLVILPCLSLLMTAIALPWSVKWWVLLASFSIALLLAVPPQMRHRALFGKLAVLPSLVWRMLVNLVHIDKNDKEFIHTTHGK